VEAGQVADAGEIRVLISARDLRAIADSAVEKVKVAPPNGEVTLNTAALRDLIAAAGGAEDGDLTEAQITALAGDETREVYDVSLYAAGERPENFTTDGKLTVGLTCELKAGENAGGV
jgi:hypothetical protein